MCTANQQKLEQLKGRAAFYYGKGGEGDRWNRITVALLVLPNKTVYRGDAKCSLKDNFVKRKGRDLALGRAISNLEHNIVTTLNDFEKELVGKLKV